jgi:cytochrome c-type biogenesis protein CcmF
MVGTITIWISFILSIFLTIAYFVAGKTDGRLKRFLQFFYYTLPSMLLIASAYLMINIINHNYQFTYIWSYSNNSLPLHILVTSFFSGQEGSFLLWAVLTSIFALAVRKYARKYGYEELVMGIFGLVLIYLTLMLILKDPFTYIWKSFPDEHLPINFMPPDGRGLNPILENFWNMIHPPILFIGYSAMTIPFVFALAGLIKKDYTNWIKIAAPWTLFAAGILGLGIMLGGFWSYETLGWGGFWGWDPVENASLMPWLLANALVHTMIVQRKTGGLIKTNFVVALLSFIFVLFSTFLTRSGVLGEMSVHSFGEPGTAAYSVLLGVLLLFLIISLVLFLSRLKDINAQIKKEDFQINSREFGLSLGAFALLLSTFVVFIGTTWPISTELFGQTKSSVDISFYDKWNLPIAVVILILNAISYYFSWRKSNWNEVFKKMLVPFIVALVGTIILILLKLDKFSFILLAFAALFSIFANLQIFLKLIKSSFGKTGSTLSHIGTAILLIGVIYSGGYSEKHTYTLAKGESVDAFGYKITFVGRNQINPERKDQERYEHKLIFEKNGKKDEVGSIIYWSDFNQRTQMFLEPGIKTVLTKDLYVSPVTFQEELNVPTNSIQKGEVLQCPYDSTINVTFNSFDMSSATTNDAGEMLFGVIATITTQNNNYTDTLYTWMNTQTFQGKPIWYPIENTNYKIGFLGLDGGMGAPGKTKALIAFNNGDTNDVPKVDYFTFQIEIKPFMYLVWIGAILAIGGFFIAIPKQLKKSKISEEENSNQ